MADDLLPRRGRARGPTRSPTPKTVRCWRSAPSCEAARDSARAEPGARELGRGRAAGAGARARRRVDREPARAAGARVRRSGETRATSAEQETARSRRRGAAPSEATAEDRRRARLGLRRRPGRLLGRRLEPLGRRSPASPPLLARREEVAVDLRQAADVVDVLVEVGNLDDALVVELARQARRCSRGRARRARGSAGSSRAPWRRAAASRGSRRASARARRRAGRARRRVDALACPRPSAGSRGGPCSRPRRRTAGFASLSRRQK